MHECGRRRMYEEGEILRKDENPWRVPFPKGLKKEEKEIKFALGYEDRGRKIFGHIVRQSFIEH